MSEWKDLVGKINSAKLNKDIEDSLHGLVYRYYNDGDKACDSRNDPYGYATKYFNALNDSLNDSEIDDIMYKPRIKYETKLKILIDYVCDAYGENSTKESKKSNRKPLKESLRVVTFEQIVDSRFDDISKGEKILQDREDEIIELCGDDFSVKTNSIRFYDGWEDGTSQYRQKYFIKKNNNKVTWNDLYKIVNSVKAVPYKFDKVSDTIFESKKSLKEKKVPYYKVEYEVRSLLNRLGCLSADFSNEENDKKINEVIDMVFELIDVLPKV